MCQDVKVDRVIDARGSFCPGPLMELIKAIREAKVGEVISVYSSDSGSKRDIPLWVEKAGHELIGVFDRNGYAEFIVRKKR
ncbi:MAG: sulfurtransferase TusA family protein [Nitrososphaerota archaeon]